MRRDVEHRKIVMAVTNDLVTDRRVDSHCRELTVAGYEVLLIGRLLPHSKEVERPYRTERMELRHLRGPKFYAEFNQRVARRIVEEKPYLVWANDSDTLPGCWWAAHRLRCRLVMDAHELFPELPEVDKRLRVFYAHAHRERLAFERYPAGCQEFVYSACGMSRGKNQRFARLPAGGAV